MKTALYIFIFLISIAATIGFVILYWQLQPTNILEIQKQPIPVKTKTVSSGGVVILVFDFCKQSDAHGLVEPSMLSNKVDVSLPPYTDYLPARCQHSLTAPIIIPYVSHTDTYYIHYKVTYQINPIKRTVIEFDTEKFTVIK